MGFSKSFLMKKYKVHFLGGEGINWALDHDIQHLTRLGSDFIEVVPIHQAEILHSVFWGAVLEVPEKHLRDKLVIASIADKPQIVMSRPEYLKVRDKIDLWLCEYHDSLHFVSNTGLRCALFPDPIDLSQFSPPQDRNAAKAALKKRLGIPDDRYLIGNFHRDSAAGALDRPKKQKGADVFLELASVLVEKGLPVHFLLAGPRRHWIRKHMEQRGIPFSFLGTAMEQDDIRENTLDLNTIAGLYCGLDAYVIASRWEGAPNSVLECAASRTPVISTRVGQSPDILSRRQIYGHAAEGAACIEDDIRCASLHACLDQAYERVQVFNSDEAIAARLRSIYQQAMLHGKGRKSAATAPARSFMGGWFRKPAIAEASPESKHELRRLAIRERIEGKKSLTFALWNDFQPPPYGGGNQFMIALEAALQRKGMKVLRNTGKGADAHVMQSVWFDRKRFEAELEPGAVVLHRVDGPIQLYRGNDFTSDSLCYEINAALADVTVMQSRWSMDQTYYLGFEPKRPLLMWNSCDGTIFNREGKLPFSTGRKTRIISTAWSNNPRKGRDTYKWIDQNLDWSRYEYTFVGRIEEAFQNIRVIEPVDSKSLADHLRAHDIYLTASQKDPCSNSLVEALFCGLPAVYLADGGHPELVEFGGIGFTRHEEIPGALDAIVKNYASFQNTIWLDTMDELAQKYIDCARHLCVI
jgi:glycosyltransferase involved in cell wall biosynthesis